MTDSNTVLIASARQEIINQVSQKLVLLRNLDKIKSCSTDDIQANVASICPNVLILHCDNNNANVINLIKQLRKQESYKNLPILLLNENCSRETTIEAFDSGITDVLFMPIIDYELLIRVIWCLNRNEQNIKNESRSKLMEVIGVVDGATGVYSAKYCDDFLKNEIIQTRKYMQNACILFLAPDKKYPSKDEKEFISIIQNSIRLNDTIVKKDSEKYYVYLQKTKLNGAYSVFERINSALGIDSGINAGVVEVREQKFEDIKEALDAALEKANENTNALIVASDFYSKEEKPSLNLQMPKSMPQRPPQAVKTTTYRTSESQSTIDKNSVKLFHQAYNRKLKIVIEPVFKKFERNLRTKDFAINSYVGASSAFSVSSGVISASFLLEYDGLENVILRLNIVDNGQKRLSETETIDFTVLDYRRVSLMLEELVNKFITILKGEEAQS